MDRTCEKFHSEQKWVNCTNGIEPWIWRGDKPHPVWKGGTSDRIKKSNTRKTFLSHFVIYKTDLSWLKMHNKHKISIYHYYIKVICLLPTFNLHLVVFIYLFNFLYMVQIFGINSTSIGLKLPEKSPIPLLHVIYC